MPIVAARVVTIVTVAEAHDRIAQGLAAMGLKAYTSVRARGRGAHGRRLGGFFESENVAFTIVTTPEHATKVLTWIEDVMSKIHPSIAYSTAADAVPGDHFK